MNNNEVAAAVFRTRVIAGAKARITQFVDKGHDEPTIEAVEAASGWTYLFDLSHWKGKPVSLWAAAPEVCSLDLDKEVARFKPKAKADEQKPMSKWEVTTDGRMLRRMGKLLEELSELSAVAARVIIQGIDGVDPASGRVNLDRLTDELADVQAQIGCVILHLGLDQDHMARRTARKMEQMDKWEQLVAPGPQATSDIYKTIPVFHSGAFTGNGPRAVGKSPSLAAPYGVKKKEPLLTESADYNEDGSWGRMSAQWPGVSDLDGEKRYFVIRSECIPYGAYVTVGATLRIHPDYFAAFEEAWSARTSGA